MPLFTVHIRRDHGRPIRPEAEQLDGNSYTFEKGWTMDANDPYPGEVAWIPRDPAYPSDAPTWIASGDLRQCEAFADEQLTPVLDDLLKRGIELLMEGT